MIDTDKYEGHAEDIERWQMMARSLPAWANDKDEQLVRDAPLLLEEVKRLREQQKKILRMAELNMALEWGDTDASVEWGAVADIIKGWIE